MDRLISCDLYNVNLVGYRNSILVSMVKSVIYTIWFDFATWVSVVKSVICTICLDVAI